MAWGTISAWQNRLLRRGNWQKRQTIGPQTEFHCFKGNPIDFDVFKWKSIDYLFRQLHRLKSRFWPAEMVPQAIPYHYPAWVWSPNPLSKHFFIKNAENLQKSCFFDEKSSILSKILGNPCQTFPYKSQLRHAYWRATGVASTSVRCPTGLVSRQRLSPVAQECMQIDPGGSGRS